MSTQGNFHGNGDTEALQKWYLARGRALRNDRNFVHYSTFVVAVLAIVAGAGGIFAVAVTQGEEELPAWALGFMLGLAALTATLLVLFGALLIGAFRLRQLQEEEEEEFLMELIKVDPERMWPERERALSPEQQDRDAKNRRETYR